MTDNKRNHPSRAKPDLPGTPTPEQILAARRAAGVSNFKAAELIMHTVAQYDAFETGERRMHPIIWWALQQRLAQRLTYDEWEATQRGNFSPVSPEAYHAERAWHAARGEPYVDQPAQGTL